MYKTILVPVDGRSGSARSVQFACRMAGQFDAHLVGLYVKPSTYVPSAARSEGAGQMLEELQSKMINELTEAARRQFETGVQGAGLKGVEWRAAEGNLAEVVALHARYADLVVVNQTDPDAADATHFADSVVLSVGRPMLLVPYAGDFRHVGRNVLVCWNARREAARAVTDALPLISRAAKVTILSVDGRASAAGHGESPGADIALYLARHGVKAEVLPAVSGDVAQIGDLILSRAFDRGIDLIVMGAYGHSRVREIMLGGATRTVLRSMTVPVLMSH